MPDITMCWNNTCPLRGKCYRYRAMPDKYWQSFAGFSPKTIDIGTRTITECDHFWNIEETGHPILSTKEVDETIALEQKDAKRKELLKNLELLVNNVFK